MKRLKIDTTPEQRERLPLPKCGWHRDRRREAFVIPQLAEMNVETYSIWNRSGVVVISAIEERAGRKFWHLSMARRGYALGRCTDAECVTALGSFQLSDAVEQPNTDGKARHFWYPIGAGAWDRGVKSEEIRADLAARASDKLTMTPVAITGDGLERIREQLKNPEAGVREHIEKNEEP